MRRLALGLATLFLGASSAHASDGTRMLRDCKMMLAILDNPATYNDQKEVNQSIFCMGFIDAASGGVKAMWSISKMEGNTPAFCWQKDVPVDQYARIFVKWLDDHPADLQGDAFVLFATAVTQAFPCPQK